MNTNFNLAEISEAIAAAIPDRECIVYRDRRITWAQFTERTRRLANYLHGAASAASASAPRCRTSSPARTISASTSTTAPSTSRRWSARSRRAWRRSTSTTATSTTSSSTCCDDADARALVYHARFAPNVARIRAALPTLERAAPGRRRLRARAPPRRGRLRRRALAASSAERPDLTWSPDDLYILYTGGTTGMPKGVLWRQEDIFFGALGGHPMGGEKFAERRGGGRGGAQAATLRACPAPPFMHGAAHWAAFMRLHAGGTIVIQSTHRAARCRRRLVARSSARGCASSPSSATPSAARSSISSTARPTTCRSFGILLLRRRDPDAGAEGRASSSAFRT